MKTFSKESFFLVGFLNSTNSKPTFVAPVFWSVDYNSTLPLDMRKRVEKCLVGGKFRGFIQCVNESNGRIERFEPYEIQTRPGLLLLPIVRGCERFLTISGDNFAWGPFEHAYAWSWVGVDNAKKIDPQALSEANRYLQTTKVKRVNDECLYCFQLETSGVVVGTKREVSTLLKEKVDDIRKHPVVYWDVAMFIGDENLIRESVALLKESLKDFDPEIILRTLYLSEIE